MILLTLRSLLQMLKGNPGQKSFEQNHENRCTFSYPNLVFVFMASVNYISRCHGSFLCHMSWPLMRALMGNNAMNALYTQRRKKLKYWKPIPGLRLQRWRGACRLPLWDICRGGQWGLCRSVPAGKTLSNYLGILYINYVGIYISPKNAS